MNTPYNELKTSYQIKGLRDVSISQSNVDGQLLTYNGSNFVDNYDVNVTTDDTNLKLANTATKSVRIGKITNSSNNTTTISLGSYAGNSNAGSNNVIIGYGAGEINKGDNSVCIGYLSANIANGSDFSTAIGREAGYSNQSSLCTALGYLAGYSNQHDNTIIVNATGSILNSEDIDRFYLKPVRNLNNGLGALNGLYYNSTTGEITYSTT